MKETEILRGLHKARSGLRAGGKYAGGFVPSQEAVDQFSRGASSMRRISQGEQTAKDIPFAAMDAAVGLARQPLSAMYNGAKSAITRTPPAAPVAKPADIAPPVLAPALDGLRRKHEELQNLSRGTAFLEGPGTGTSDSVPVNLSRGEAVLPAKTVRKLGPENIARIIQETNDGKAPKGLRAGGSYNTGLLEKAVGGLSADDLDMKKVQPAANMPPKPVAAPAAAAQIQQKYVPPKVDPLTGTYARQAAQAAPTAAVAAAAPLSPPLSPTPSPAAPEGLWSKTKFYAGQGVGKVADTLPGKDAAGKVAAGLGAAVEGGLAVRDMATEGMDGFDRTGRGVEAANRVSGGALGASLGATLGSVVPVVGTALGGLAGGYLGATYGPQLAQKLSNWTNGRDDVLPSEKAAGLRAKQLAAQNPPPAPSTQPQATQHSAPAAQTQATAAPAPAPAPHPQDAGPHPDLTGQLNSMPKDLSQVKGLQQGAIYKTMDANGNPVYSGMNVGANAQFVDGQGNSIKPRGGVYSGIVGEGSNVVNGNAGLRAAQSGGGADVSAALQAAAARGDWGAVQQHYQRNGGTWLGKTAEQDAQTAASNDAARARQLLMGDVQRGLAGGGRLTRSGMAALQGVANNEAQREASRAAQSGAQYRHDTPSGDAKLNAQVHGEKNALDAQRANASAALDARAKGSEALDKQLDLDPASYGPDGKLDPSRRAALADYVARSGRMVKVNGKDVDFATAMRVDPQGAKQALAAASGELSLQELAKSKGQNFWFKNTPKAGEIKLAEDVSRVNMKDYEGGMTLSSMIKEGLFGDGVVRLQGPNNTTVSLPLSEIKNHSNSAAIMQALNEAIANKASQK